MKRLLSGIQPSGQLHIGNYFGALNQFVDLQDTYENFIFVANFHALTTINNPVELRALTREVIATYLAVGLDPQKTTLYVQSDVPEVTELAWIFETLITVPYLQRAHAYKDKVANNIEPTVGLFNYPALMAADILIVRPDIVPVGQDQKQHVEITRDIAEKFNNVYGDFFKLPEPYVLESVATVPGTDGRKMSKSYNNTIPLFATDTEIEKAVMSIPTDSKGVDEPKNPNEDGVFAFHTLVTPEPDLSEIKKGYEQGGLSYADSKKKLVESMKGFISPLRERYNEIIKDTEALDTIIKNGAEKAREQALLTMHEVRERVGLR